MTYVEFLAIFLLPPIAIALLVLRDRLPRGLLLWQLPLLAVVATVYTAPWDRQLIVDGVWSYQASQVVGGTLLSVPIEEYGFYILQVVLCGLVAGALWSHQQGRRGRPAR